MTGCRSQAANTVDAWAGVRVQIASAVTWECSICAKVFNTKQALAGHRWKKHGCKRPERLLVSTVHCEACMLHFGTRLRVLNHVCERSMICRNIYHALGPSLSAAQADVLDAQDALDAANDRKKCVRRGIAKTACVRLAGPLIQQAAPYMRGVGQQHWFGNGHRLQLLR